MGSVTLYHYLTLLGITMRLFIVAIIFSFITFASAYSVQAEEGKTVTKLDFNKAYRAYTAAQKDGSPDEKTASALKAYTLGKEYHKNNPKTLGILAQNYAGLERDTKKSIRAFSHALKQYELAYGKDAFELADILIELAKVKVRHRHTFSNNSQFSRAKKLIRTHKGKDSIEMARFHMTVGKLALQYGQRSALNSFQEAKNIYETKADTVQKAEIALTNFWMGKFYLANRQLQKATKELTTSLDTFTETSSNSQLTMINHATLIEVYERRHLRDEATKHCLAIGRATPQKDDQDYLPVFQVHPKYPISAQQARIEGYAIVELTVDEKGFVHKPTIVEMEGSKSFGKEALKAAKEFRYIPKFKDGRPVRVTGVRYKFSFNLT